MRKQEKNAIPAVGGSSLLVVFAVLCMTVFAMMSLSTVQAQQRLAEAGARSVSAYYDADLEAERIFARLRAGQLPEGVAREGDIYRYTCPVSAHQVLAVEVRQTREGWEVLHWQTVAQPIENDDSLPVWGGQ